ncbi:hypothetical protein [Phocaeicola coprophilus]
MGDNLVNGGSTRKNYKNERKTTGKFTCYKVTERELQIFQKGNDGGWLMNIGLSSLFCAIGCLISLLCATFENEVLKGIVIAITSLGFLAAIILLYKSSKSKSYINDIVEDIKRESNDID